MKKGIILYVFIVSVLVVVTIIMGNMAYQEVRGVQKLGKVSLRPVKVEVEENTRKEGDTIYITGYTYYIIYEYQWEGSTEKVRFRCNEVYSKNNRDIAEAAVKNQEIIERSVYLDSAGNTHFSKCETKEEFQTKSIRNAIMVYIILILIISCPGIFWLMIHFARKKEIDFIQSQRPDAVICTGLSFSFCFFMEIGLSIMIMGICMLVNCAGEPVGMMACGVLFTLMGLALTITLFLHSWNRRVVLDKEEILFKNAFGREKRYSKAEITQFKTLNYSTYNGSMFVRRRNFYIRVGKDLIAMNNLMTNYYEAIEFANRNYVCEETENE